MRIAIAVSRFNPDITEALLEGCLHTLTEAGVADEKIEVLRVPGAFELPLACETVAARGGTDAIIALGCVIRGGTPHFDYVCSGACQGVLEVGLRHRLPVILGVLTCDTLAQARHRADREVLTGAASLTPATRLEKETPRSNKGAEAAAAALEMANLMRRLR